MHLTAFCRRSWTETDQGMYVPDGWTHGWVDRQIDGWDRRPNRCTAACMDARLVYEQLEGFVSGCRTTRMCIV